MFTWRLDPAKSNLSNIFRIAQQSDSSLSYLFAVFPHARIIPLRIGSNRYVLLQNSFHQWHVGNMCAGLGQGRDTMGHNASDKTWETPKRRKLG
jgi:hypothetical protein